MPQSPRERRGPSTSAPPPVHSARGPPNNRPLASKKVHRRSPRACDECRLRKRACDAGQPCGPCHRSGIDCSYQFRRPVPRPTSRIRSLQDHLQQARGWLQQIKDKNSGPVAGLDLGECLRALDFTIPDYTAALSPPPPSQPSPSGGYGHTVERRNNMLAGHDRFVEKGPGVACFYGAYSDMSFILRTIELLEVGPSEGQDQRLCIISNLLSRPLHHRPDSLELSAAVYDVPDNTAALLDAVFARGDLMLCFLTEQPLRATAANPRSVSISGDHLQLLHMVIALGYLYSFREHGVGLCEEALRQATKHFCIGMTAGLAGLAQDLTSIQTVLCAIVFLFSGYRTGMAHALIGMACSSALRLGLLSASSIASGASADDRRTRTRILAAVLTVDMLGSMILDLSPFIHRESVPHARLVELAVQAEAEGDLLTASLLRQCSLLAVPLSIRSHATGSRVDDQPEGSSIRLFQSALDECQRWKRHASPLMAKLGRDPKHLWAKKDLDMMYNLTQIILFRPHLHYIREMYAGKAVSVAESYYALACVKVASSTIVLAADLRAQPPLRAESWLTLHTVFSAVMCLVFLVAAHPATTLPSIAWQKASVGIRLIAANKCADNISTVCLEVLKMVTGTLRETIYIDFDKIEAATASNYNKSGGTPSGYIEMAEENQPPEELPFRRQQDVTIDHEASEGGHGFNSFNSEVDNEADRILEKAEALSLNTNLECLVDFGSSE